VSWRLRGWHYSDCPVKPVVSGSLSVSTIASDFCPTARDLYLRYIEGFEAIPSPPMVRGTLYHGTLEAVVTTAKKLVYDGITPDLNFGRAFDGQGGAVIDGLIADERESIEMAEVRSEELQQIRSNMMKLWNSEACQISAAVISVLSSSPHINSDSLVAHAIPLTIEHRIDGSHIGLSRGLSIDAFQSLRPMIMEMKTGKEQEFHRLTLAGYALAFESAFERAVDFGMLAYLRFIEDRPVPYVIRRVYPIDDELRLQFLQMRDRKLEIISQQLDPGLPSRCPSACSYIEICRG
jgi:CRISPR-associated protein Csa1